MKPKHSYICKKDMSYLQLDEYLKLSRLIENEIRLIGYDTRDLAFRKRNEGFSLYKKCYESTDCKSTWICNVQVSNLKCEIYLHKRCEHLKMCQFLHSYL